MSLSDFIEENMERLLVEWESFAQTCLPAAENMGSRELRNGAMHMLMAVAADLKTFQSAGDQHKKSRGLKDEEHTSDLGSTARSHAEERLAGGFNIDQLASEYRALRSSVVHLWSSSPGFPTRDMVQEMTRFNEAIDQSLAESVRWYSDRLERARAIYVGVLGHDLRTPLATLMISVETAQRTHDPKVIQDCIVRARRSGERISEMIDLLLDFSRTHLGEKIPLSPTMIDLSDVCGEIAGDFAARFPDRKITVECPELTGRWDEARVYQALSNLVQNAIQYGKTNDPIKISTKGEAQEVLLSVHNEGSVISRAKQQAIFEPFSKPAADDERYRDPEHVGLGLYTVNQIARAHGGRVEIDSNAEAGTTVTMRLPREQDPR